MGDEQIAIDVALVACSDAVHSSKPEEALMHARVALALIERWVFTTQQREMNRSSGARL